MQAKYKIALALAVGFALGAGAIHGLHAAASPPAYVINEIAVKDEDGYKKDFLPGAQKAIDDNGGTYIAGGFNKTVAITGQDRVVILQFENMDKSRRGGTLRAMRKRRSAASTRPSAPSQWKASRNTEGAISNDEDPGNALGTIWTGIRSHGGRASGPRRMRPKRCESWNFQNGFLRLSQVPISRGLAK